MRRDFVLPVLLVVALTGMAVYATTGKRARAAELVTTPVRCESAQLIGRLPELEEASGLAASRQQKKLFWAHNDSAAPVLLAVSADGKMMGRVTVAGAAVEDWEAVTVAECPAGTCVYVGDIGDNDRRRRTITVYRTAEPSPSATTTAAVETFVASYPEGPQDAEALFVVDGTLFVVTKGEGTPVRVYRFPSLDHRKPAKLQLVASLSDGDAGKSARVTDAAVSPNGQWIALRTNDLLLFYAAAPLLAGKPGVPMAFDLRTLKEPQGEGLAWADDRTLYLAGEAKAGGTFGRVTCALPQ